MRSPNTPGLRNLQGKQELENLISQVLKARDAICEDKRRVPVLLKIAPDLSTQDKVDIADVIMQNPQVT